MADSQTNETSETNELNTSASEDASEKLLEKPEPIGYAASNLKFWVMSVITFGYYVLWWAYKNFHAMRIPGPNKFGSLIFACFFPISMFELLKAIEAKAVSRGIPFRLNKLLVAVLYFVFLTTMKLALKSEETAILGLLAGILALVCVFFAHRQILKINRELGAEIDSKFTIKDFAFIVIALILSFTVG